MKEIKTIVTPIDFSENAVHAMQSGLVFGYVALIEGMIKRMASEMRWDDYRVIGTGGHIDIIRPHTNIIDHYEPWLTLFGLQLIYQLNSED